MNPARDLEIISLHARETAVKSRLPKDEAIAMSNFAVVAGLLRDLAPVISDTSPRADQNLDELACLLAEIGSDMHAHFTREPTSPVELMRAEQDHNSKMMREGAA